MGDGGVRIVGSPVGTDDFCRRFCNEKVAEYSKRPETIGRFPNKQIAQKLLRECHCTRLVFLMRTTPPRLVEEAARTHDANTRKALERVLACPPDAPLTDDAWQQAQLPARMAGLGMWSSHAARDAAGLRGLARRYARPAARGGGDVAHAPQGRHFGHR